MFGFFKKKPKDTPHYDPTNISISDMRKGWFVDYDDKTWQAVEEYEYDWGKNRFSYEFMLQNGDGETLYLSLMERDGLECTMTQKLRFGTLPQAEEIEDSVQRTDKPPRELIINNIRFYRERETPGYFRNIDKEEFSEFIVWEYRDDSELYILEVEQWGDDEFELYIGRMVPERQLSNITPGGY